MGGTAFADESLALAWYGFKGKDRSVEVMIDVVFANDTKSMTKALEKADTLAYSLAFATVMFRQRARLTAT